MVSLPPRREKLHYTFDNPSLEKIGRENFNLLMRLNTIATRAPEFGGSAGAKAAASRPAHVRSRAEIEREKRAREIDKSNAILLKKLQATKPSVTKYIETTGRGAGVSLGQPASFRSPVSPGRPEWVDPTDSRTGARADARRLSGGGSGNRAAHAGLRSSRELALSAGDGDAEYGESGAGDGAEEDS
jgi:hypothetical protein